MKKIIFTPLFILMTFITFSQGENDVIYDVVDTAPQYPGGLVELSNFIANNFEYPEESINLGEQGTIWLEFVIFADGSIGNIRIVKGISLSLDNEAMRVISIMPYWIPGIKNGENVNTRFILPIKAKLAETEPEKSKKKKNKC